MIPAAFAYQRATSIDDAARVLGQNHDAKVLAGGHSLIPLMRLRLAQPSVLVDINGLEGEFGYVRRDNGSLRIGALTRHYQIYQSDEVRRYVIDNVLEWLRDYHLDGLRLDAVHALRDTRAIHLLEELAAEVDRLATYLGRPLSLIAESDLNDPRLVTAREGGGYGLGGQWCDDVHHSLHTALTGESQGYYADFATAGLTGLAHVLTRAFLHEGTWSSFRALASIRSMPT